jgi:hypothetical protein
MDRPHTVDSRVLSMLNSRRSRFLRGHGCLGRGGRLRKVSRRNMRLRILALDVSRTAVRTKITWAKHLSFKLCTISVDLTLSRTKYVCNMLDSRSGIEYSDINCILRRFV